MEYEEMRRMEKTHCCAQCNGVLVIRWNGDFDNCELVCGSNPNHSGYKQTLSPAQALRQGTLDSHLGPGAQKDAERAAALGAPALSRLPDRDIATNRELSSNDVARLCLWGEGLGLKPYLGHVCLYFNKPYVTIDGYYYLLAQQTTLVAIGSRPLNSQERQEYGLGEGDIAWLACAWLHGKQLPTTGLGIVTKGEIEGKSTKKPDEFRAPVVHAHPQRIAEKRAEWQLLRKLIPLQEAKGEEVKDETRDEGSLSG